MQKRQTRSGACGDAGPSAAPDHIIITVVPRERSFTSDNDSPIPVVLSANSGQGCTTLPFPLDDVLCVAGTRCLNFPHDAVFVHAHR